MLRHAFMWCSQVWREMNPQHIQNNWGMSKILLAQWSVDFAMDNECEKSQMNKATNELARRVISSLNIGSEEMTIE